jgi:uncharacterized protein YjbI with pentapeptide repeats
MNDQEAFLNSDAMEGRDNDDLLPKFEEDELSSSNPSAMMYDRSDDEYKTQHHNETEDTNIIDDDDKIVKILIECRMIADYIFRVKSFLTNDVHRIVSLNKHKKIICYILDVDLFEIIDEIKEIYGEEFATEIEDRIRYDFEIYQINEADMKLFIEHEPQVAFEQITVSCLEAKIFTAAAVVTADLTNKPLEAHAWTRSECNTYRECGIKIYPADEFYSWYASGFLLASLKTKEHYDKLKNIAKLKRQVDGTEKQPCLALPQIGRGWFFDSFEVLSSDLSVVTANIKLQDRKNKILYTFPATGNGTINALHRAVDAAIFDLTERKIIKRELPTIKDIWLFHLSDIDRRSDSQVDCKVIIYYQHQHYIGKCKHTDTIKAALYAYVLAINNVLNDNPSDPNLFLTSKMIQRQYNIDNRRNFVGITAKIDHLIGCKLAAANFSRSDFHNTLISKCDFTESAWRGTDLINSKLVDNNFTSADLSGVDLTNACMINSQLTRTSFFQAKMFNANLSRNDFSEADLSSTISIKADFSKSIMRGCLLLDAQMSRADLSKVDLSDANLTNADLSKVDLSNANLTNADLTDVNLTDANLTNANLTGTSLRNVDLRTTNLTGTRLDRNSSPSKLLSTSQEKDNERSPLDRKKYGRKIYRIRSSHEFIKTDSCR